jgi:hypothetical protein
VNWLVNGFVVDLPAFSIAAVNALDYVTSNGIMSIGKCAKMKFWPAFKVLRQHLLGERE